MDVPCTLNWLVQNPIVKYNWHQRRPNILLHPSKTAGPSSHPTLLTSTTELSDQYDELTATGWFQSNPFQAKVGIVYGRFTALGLPHDQFYHQHTSTVKHQHISTLKNRWDSLRLWDSQHIATLCHTVKISSNSSPTLDTHRRSSTLIDAPPEFAAPLRCGWCWSVPPWHPQHLSWPPYPLPQWLCRSRNPGTKMDEVYQFVWGSGLGQDVNGPWLFV